MIPHMVIVVQLAGRNTEIEVDDEFESLKIGRMQYDGDGVDKDEPVISSPRLSHEAGVSISIAEA